MIISRGEEREKRRGFLKVFDFEINQSKLSYLYKRKAL